MSQELLILLFGVLPAFLLVGYIYKLDSYQREPFKQLLKGMAYGVGSILVALFLAEVIAVILPCNAEENSIGRALYTAFLQAAVPEEMAKLAMLWLLVHKNPYFDERMDGIVYSVAVAMGFAGFENVTYLFSNIEDWRSVAFSRAIFSVPGHFAFAVLMGYYYGLVHFEPSRYGRYRIMVLLSPIVAHGTFDGLLMLSPAMENGVAAILYIVFIFFCIRMHRFCRTRVSMQLKRDKDAQYTQDFAKSLGRFGNYNKNEKS